MEDRANLSGEQIVTASRLFGGEQIALITGAASGIGAATATLLSERSAVMTGAAIVMDGGYTL
jgi:NADP-dependent 3-hydroxy acid dehydrogenase YdfG